ncbi:MAG: hypothetical protein CVT97_04130 [Bacteroidetes bacterium HGW-Bacteroidetes-14]|nr:MAG: hypothetical protein CVT97_04130 [Bacteroidetes bacterium HGW-Bacteroidetes-14]
MKNLYLTMSRKILITGLALLMTAAVFTGCKNHEKDVTLKTTEFLKAYFNADYDSAGQFCTDSLKMELARMLESYDSLDPSIKEMVKKQAQNVTTEVISVVKSEQKDTILVKYKVVLPSFPSGVDNTLSFVKQNKEWKVAELGNKI